MYVSVIFFIYTHIHRLPGGTMVNNLLANVGDTYSIPGLGRFPGEGMATHSNILTWTISWREEPGGLQSFGPQELDMTQQISVRMCARARTHTHTHTFLRFSSLIGYYKMPSGIPFAIL